MLPAVLTLIFSSSLPHVLTYPVSLCLTLQLFTPEADGPNGEKDLPSVNAGNWCHVSIQLSELFAHSHCLVLPAHHTAQPSTS